jgi:hypothetical protein
VTSRALSRRAGNADVPRWGTARWSACLPERGAVEAALAAIRTWQPYDGHAWLDDVGNVLGSVPQAESRMDELAQRLRGCLMQLVGYTVNSGVEAKDQRAVKGHSLNEQSQPTPLLQSTP